MLDWYTKAWMSTKLLPNLSVYLVMQSPRHYWYLTATPDLLSQAASRFESYTNQRVGYDDTVLPAAALVQAFFVEYLLNQKNASQEPWPHTGTRSFAPAIYPRDQSVEPVALSAPISMHPLSCIPRPYRTEASQQCPFEKCATGGHTFIFPIHPDA